MNTPQLSEKEQIHIEAGGRLLLVEEIPGPLWRVLAVKQSGATVLLKPNGADGYEEPGFANYLATNTASLSVDSPMLRLAEAACS